jgi:hypothetical protein
MLTLRAVRDELIDLLQTDLLRWVDVDEGTVQCLYSESM